MSSLHSFKLSEARRYHPYNTRTIARTRSESLPTVSTLPPTVPSTLTPPKPNRLRITELQFEKARNQLLNQPSSGPVTLAQGISLEVYSKYLSSHEDLPVRTRLMDGNVEAYELPLDPHTNVTGRIISMIGGWDIVGDLCIGTDLEMVVGVDSMLMCDCYVRPWRRPRPPQEQGANSLGTPYPTVVVKVAATQSLNDAHAKVADWFSPRTTIQLCLVIKIWELRQDNTIAMAALLYRRQDPNPLVPVSAISFGTARITGPALQTMQGIIGGPNLVNGVGYGGVPCDAPGIPMYQLNLPAVDIYNGDPQGIPAGNVLGFNLDLWVVQLWAWRSFSL
ncbi:hypothetical protein BGZ79_007547 [Entomortierella chlamydospora]|nr:hypothetical protein BGZ79_007543 [Entomortierella chlamydospora]KAF9998796.1 hypothetical protein BGZ79_007547 [Entomortierella chlamydospora]